MECGLKRIYYLVTFLPEKWYRYMDYFRGILVFLLPSVWTYGLANWTHGSGWQHLAIRPPPHSPLEEKPWNRSKVEATVSESSRPGVCSRRVLEFSLTPGFVRFNEEQKFCNIWAGNDGTVARTHQTEHIYVWGFNATGQLGLRTFVCLFIYFIIYLFI